MRTAVILFLVFAPVQSTVLCYSLFSEDYRTTPNTTTKLVKCEGPDALCTKTVTFRAVSYGCDVYGEACFAMGAKKNSCNKDGGVNMCCCDSDKCNSSRSHSFLYLALFPIVSSLYL